MPFASLDRSVAPSCLVFHRTKPFLALVRASARVQARVRKPSCQMPPTAPLNPPRHAACLPAQGVSTFVAVYDMLSGSRLSRINLKETVVQLCFSPDGTALIALLQVRGSAGVRMMQHQQNRLMKKGRARRARARMHACTHVCAEECARTSSCLGHWLVDDRPRTIGACCTIAG